MYLFFLAAPIWLPPLLLWVGIRQYLNDDLDPRPFLNAFFAGAMVTLPVGIVEAAYLPPLLKLQHPAIATLTTAWLGAAVPEETARALLLVWWVSRKRGFAQPHWVIATALALAMGAVTAENALKFYHLAHEPWNAFWLLMLRTAFCIPTFAAYSLSLGVPIAWKLYKGENWLTGVAEGLLLAIVAHGVYDSILIVSSKTITTSSPDGSNYIMVAAASFATAIAYLPVRARFNRLSGVQSISNRGR